MLHKGLHNVQNKQAWHKLVQLNREFRSELHHKTKQKVRDRDWYINIPQACKNGTGKGKAHLDLELVRDANSNKAFITTAAATD